MNCKKNSTTIASAIVCYLLIGFSVLFLTFSICYLLGIVDVGMEVMCGRTIAQEQVCGKEQMVGKSYPSVAVMMISPQQILW